MHIETLKVDSQYQLPLSDPSEIMTSAVFNPNGTNIAVGSSTGSLYLGSIKTDPQGKAKVSFGRFDHLQATSSAKSVQAITAL